MIDSGSTLNAAGAVTATYPPWAEPDRMLGVRQGDHPAGRHRHRGTLMNVFWHTTMTRRTTSWPDGDGRQEAVPQPCTTLLGVQTSVGSTAQYRATTRALVAHP